MARVWTDPHMLKPCDNPTCDRKTTKRTLFCCAPCEFAVQTKSEITAHSDGCEERHAIRSDPANRRIGIPFETGLPDHSSPEGSEG